MEKAISKSRAERDGIYPDSLRWIVPMVLLLSSLVFLTVPQRTWGAVYECMDAAGKPILTNKPANLHNCHMVSREIAPDPTSPAGPASSNREPDYEPSSDRPPAPNPDASSSPPTLQPCDLGMDPGSLLGAPPCIPSGQSGVQQPKGVQTPSP